MFNNKKIAPEKENNLTQVPETPEEPVKTEPKTRTVLAKGVYFEGDIITNEDVIVRGTIKGNMVSTASLFVDEGGQIDGNFKAESLNIEGSAKGTLISKTVTIIGNNGSIVGDLTSKTLHTSDDSYFEGKLLLPKTPKQKVEDTAPAQDSAEVPDSTEIEY